VNRSIILIVLVLAGLVASGCNDKDDPVVLPPTPEYTLPFPDTPDQLMENFETAYAGMDLAVYRDEVLAETYDFVLTAETVEEFALPDNVFDRDEELAIAQRMFSGQLNSDGRVLWDIQIQVLAPEGTWLPVPVVDPYFGSVPGALFRNYHLLFYFNMQGDFRYAVMGNQLFYVVPDTVMHEGVMTPRFRLRGQLDQTAIIGPKSTEAMTWGSVKALYE